MIIWKKLEYKEEHEVKSGRLLITVLILVLVLLMSCEMDSGSGVINPQLEEESLVISTWLYGQWSISEPADGFDQDVFIDAGDEALQIGGTGDIFDFVEGLGGNIRVVENTDTELEFKVEKSVDGTLIVENVYRFTKLGDHEIEYFFSNLAGEIPALSLYRVGEVVSVTFSAQGELFRRYDHYVGFPYTQVPDPITVGQIFDGWYTQLNGGGTIVIDGADVDISEDHTLYAKFKDLDGSAGGLVFYENPNWGTDGWRYLEAVPDSAWYEDISDYSAPYDPERRFLPLTLDLGRPLETGIGTGEENTEAYVTAISSTDWTDAEKAFSPAMVCYNLVYGGADDWFLPSIMELVEMDNALTVNRIRPISAKIGTLGKSSKQLSGYLYWSSSTGASYSLKVLLDVSTGEQHWEWSSYGSFRPIRAFQ